MLEKRQEVPSSASKPHNRRRYRCPCLLTTPPQPRLMFFFALTRYWTLSHISASFRPSSQLFATVRRQSASKTTTWTTLGRKYWGLAANNARNPVKTKTELFLSGGASLGISFATFKNLTTQRAYCEYKAQKTVKTRIAGLDESFKDSDPAFPWKEFMRLLWPEVWYLLGAVVVSECFFGFLWLGGFGFGAVRCNTNGFQTSFPKRNKFGPNFDLK